MAIFSCQINYSAVPSENQLTSIPKHPNLDDSHNFLQLSKLYLKLDHTFIAALSHLPSLILDELQTDFVSDTGLSNDTTVQGCVFEYVFCEFVVGIH